ncbi:MAG: P1 family peptidase, partial [Bacillota bacterium]
GPVRTGVTVVVPHEGNLFREKVPAAVFAFNGYGKAIGLVQIQETGTLESPIAVTGTLNVARVADALMSWILENNPDVGLGAGTANPVVTEIHDGFLNDARGRHVREEHLRQALASAAPGPVQEGAVGAGTGAVAFGWKGGVGTASRLLPPERGGWCVGSLVVTNFDGALTIAGLPVGPLMGRLPRPARPRPSSDGGSVIVVLATDAPLGSRNLARLARRAVLGLARTGFYGGNTSGDFVIAFTTAYRVPHGGGDLPSGAPLVEAPVQLVRNDAMGPLFLAAVEATEEAVLNALFKATTVAGRDGHVAEALDLDRLRQVLRANRWMAPGTPGQEAPWYEAR